ncbi:uncharacterized protein LOC134780535 [Penaeus indicus]|uniref:uncharacterized protein LOC134780535 n=1 Tax=Penaeus indicus TaxID=29960 RepID=UPI00300BFECA
MPPPSAASGTARPVPSAASSDSRRDAGPGKPAAASASLLSSRSRVPSRGSGSRRLVPPCPATQSRNPPEESPTTPPPPPPPFSQPVLLRTAAAFRPCPALCITPRRSRRRLTSLPAPALLRASFLAAPVPTELIALINRPGSIKGGLSDVFSKREGKPGACLEKWEGIREHGTESKA